MSNNKLTSEEEAALWVFARQQLDFKKLKTTVPLELVERFRAQLPTQQKGESLGDLIRRASSKTQSTAEIKPFKPKPIKRFKPLTEFVRLAADTHEGELPLPDPESILESEDGQFRLKVTAINNEVNIVIQALGLAADQFANCNIGLLDPSDENESIAVIRLDQDGDGLCQTKDTPSLRRALLKPVLVLIE